MIFAKKVKSLNFVYLIGQSFGIQIIHRESIKSLKFIKNSMA